MNLIPILMLSAVIVLGGCTQNAARKKQPVQPAQAAVDTPKTSTKGENTGEPTTAAKPSTQVTLTDKNLKTESVNAPDNTNTGSTNTSTVAKSTTPVAPSAPVVPSAKSTGAAPATSAGAPQVGGSVAAPSGQAPTAPMKPAPVAAPSEPVKTLPPPQITPAPQPSAGPQANVNPPAATTAPAEATAPAPAEKATPSAKNPSRLPEEPATTAVTPQPRTIREAREKDAGPQTTTVVVIQPPATAATGSTTGATAGTGTGAASVGRAPVKTPVPTAKPAQLQEIRINENKATKEPLALLINKIKSLHAKTAERFEKVLKEVKFVAVDGSMEDAWAKNQAVLLVADFKLPVDSDFKVIHLRDSVLLPIADLQNADKGSRLIVEAILLRLAADDLQNQNKKLDATGMATLTGLTHSIAQNLLTTRDRLNSRLLFDNLRYAQVSVADWKFDELSGPDVGGELIRISGRKFKLIAAKPRSDFKLKESASDESETCRLNFNYGGMVGGIDITTVEPEWNEFKLNFMMKEDEVFPLLPSMAGDKYLDLEIRQKNNDGSSQRFTLRYLVETKNGKSERRAHHVVIEKLPAKGEATQMLMCAFNDGEATTPAAPPQETPAKDTSGTDKEVKSPLPESTALPGPHAGSMAQRYRPAPVNPGVTGSAAIAPTGAKTEAPHAGSTAQRYRPANWNQAETAQTPSAAATETKKEPKAEEKNSIWDNFYMLGP